MNRGKCFALSGLNLKCLVQNIIYVVKKASSTKSVEASAFVLSIMYFSQHIDRGKCFIQNI